jgi:hypothetical protein
MRCRSLFDIDLRQSRKQTSGKTDRRRKQERSLQKLKPIFLMASTVGLKPQPPKNKIANDLLEIALLEAVEG